MPAHRAARSRRLHAAALGGLTLMVALGPGTGAALAAGGGDENCGDFTYQEDAQKVYDADTSDPNHLDHDHDGRACEDRPHRPVVSDVSTVSQGPSRPAAVSTPSRRADRDCADFSSRSAAQAVLDADPSDPNRLDADHDGKACEAYAYAGDVVTVPVSTASSSAPSAPSSGVDDASTTPVGAADTGDGSSVVASGAASGSSLLSFGLLGGTVLAGSAAVARRRRVGA